MSPSTHLSRSTPLFDAFGRLRVGQLETLFDSKLSYGKLPILWNEAVSANASSIHVEVDSCVNMAVTANGAFAIRQTRQRWNYQPGKSQILLATFKMPTAAGVTARVGLVHGDSASPHTAHDGIFFEVANGVASVNIIKGTESGGIVNTEKATQSQWNMDKLDGSGPSGKIADWSKAQILMIDFQWLGVGGVRFGFEVDSTMVYVHEFLHAGMVDSVYMHNGTQPARYEIRSTGGTGILSQICSSVASEGGAQKTGITTAIDTNGSLISCAASSIQMLVAVRITAANPDVQLLIEKVYALNTAANTSYRWVVLWNPTIAGTPNWVAETGTPVEVWRGGVGTTMTGGTALDSGYTSRDNRQTNEITAPSVHPGMSIAGVPDVIALGIESIGGTSTCSGGVAVRQLV